MKLTDAQKKKNNDRNTILNTLTKILNINNKIAIIRNALEDSGLSADDWSEFVTGENGDWKTKDARPIPPFTVYETQDQNRSDAAWSFAEGPFWDIEDAQNFIWNDASENDMHIRNYAGNVCWIPEDYFSQFDDDEESQGFEHIPTVINPFRDEVFPNTRPDDVELIEGDDDVTE